MRAAEDGETMVQLCNRLQHAALTEELVPESEEEASRTVEFYDMVMHVPQSRRRSQRVKEANAKIVALQPAPVPELAVQGEQVTNRSGSGRRRSTAARA